jgi:uncharacterized membrane protein YraQ (UPF0718 family)
MFAWWQWLVDRGVYDLAGLEPKSRLGSAINFFLYDTVKIFILLVVIITAVAFARSFLSPERMRHLLAGKRQFIGNGLAAGVGVATPFCSCSAVPMFIGMVEAGVPIGVTFSFLVSAPTVNEVALVMLFGLYGFGVGSAYLATGLAIAVVAGIAIGRMSPEKWIEPYVFEIRMGSVEVARPSLRERSRDSIAYTKNILKRIWPWVLAGLGVGALIHGYVPVDFIARVAGPANPFAVPVAVLVAIPLYSNAAGTIPVVQALVGKGLPMGTALAFMMGVVALSFPEFMLLRKVMKWQLLAVYASVVGAGIIAVGYLFNVQIGRASCRERV